jgi:dTDP-4-amino-4,6-dideoxygalactose transaminase
MKWRVPFFDLQLGDEEKHAVRDVLDSNWLTAGPRIAEFETRFSTALGGEVTSVAVSSATAALHLSLLALGVGPGDEVIVPSLTFVACANAIRYTGATPVFADIIGEDNWNICPVDTARKISARTKVIMVVHYAGYPCAMHPFLALAHKHGIEIIEDCSHAPVARTGGRMAGTIGKLGCFSFFSNKNMTTGEGGMVTTASAEVAERLRILRSHGITASTYQRFKGHAYGYDVGELGFNYRLDEIRAALGIEQLKKLSEFTRQRGERVSRYRQLLKAHLPVVKAPFEGHRGESSFHIFPVLLPCGIDGRNAVLKAMGEQGVQCSMHYRPIHTFSAYEGHSADVPVTDRVAGSILTLPLFPSMTDDQISDVVETLSRCLSIIQVQAI